MYKKKFIDDTKKFEMKHGSYRITVPIITNMEMDNVKNCKDDLIEKFVNSIVHEKDLIIVQELVKLQKEKIELKDKMIYLMADTIREDRKTNNNLSNKKYIQNIIRYFEKKAKLIKEI